MIVGNNPLEIAPLSKLKRRKSDKANAGNKHAGENIYAKNGGEPVGLHAHDPVKRSEAHAQSKKNETDGAHAHDVLLQIHFGIFVLLLGVSAKLHAKENPNCKNNHHSDHIERLVKITGLLNKNGVVRY